MAFWFTGEKRKGKRLHVFWVFFLSVMHLVSFTAVSLIYSNCGETLRTEQCWISQKTWDGSFGLSSYHLQCYQSENMAYFRFQSLQFVFSVIEQKVFQRSRSGHLADVMNRAFLLRLPGSTIVTQHTRHSYGSTCQDLLPWLFFDATELNRRAVSGIYIAN